MSKTHFVTMASLNRALDRVVPELERHGFWDDAVEEIDVCLVPVGGAYGWQYFGEGGEIGIPAVSLSKLLDWWRGDYTALADVLRHEYGHAVADTHRGLVRSRQFVEAFQASHESDIEWDYDPEIHVSEYAAFCPSEDFAEVCMLFLKRGGALPSHLDTPNIRAKWNFIRRLGRAIRAGQRRWH